MCITNRFKGENCFESQKCQLGQLLRERKSLAWSRERTFSSQFCSLFRVTLGEPPSLWTSLYSPGKRRQQTTPSRRPLPASGVYVPVFRAENGPFSTLEIHEKEQEPHRERVLGGGGHFSPNLLVFCETFSTGMPGKWLKREWVLFWLFSWSSHLISTPLCETSPCLHGGAP